MLAPKCRVFELPGTSTDLPGTYHLRDFVLLAPYRRSWGFSLFCLVSETSKAASTRSPLAEHSPSLRLHPISFFIGTITLIVERSVPLFFINSACELPQARETGRGQGGYAPRFGASLVYFDGSLEHFSRD